jgi:hypothetical protein
MSSSFSAVSLVIDLDEEYYPPKTIAIGGPAAYEPRRSRVVLHETLHYWQQLAHGFLARLAAEEWRRLLAFRKSGKYPPVGDLRRRYVAQHPTLGFSVRTLHEALTRGWEVHCCNPRAVLSFEREARLFTDEAFWARFDQLDAKGLLTGRDSQSYSDIAYELAMQGAGGRYAAPFRYLVERTDRVRAGIAFPLAAHFALQTPDPVESYAQIAPVLAEEATPDRPARIEDLWVHFYDRARQRVGPILDASGQEYLSAEDVIRQELADHPGYQRAIERLGRLKKDTWRVPSYHLYAQVPEPIRQRQTADIVLCTPGISVHRALLIAHLPPPLVQFTDGRTWQFGECWNAEFPDSARFDAAESHRDAEDALAINTDWKRMLNVRWS